ncbi:hypothetical protein HD554DRAFT_2014631 [Boletus coccyginus]|nr:hypothetical protein HD554DRAFT_2014631 [Boletus coccyginus]
MAFPLTGPIQNCSVMQLIICTFWVLASKSSSYLFLKCVHAIFPQERLVHHAFTVLWMARVGTSVLVFPGTLNNYQQIANTKHCTNVEVKSYVSAAFIVPVVFDSFVFFAITYKILVSHCNKKPKNWKTFVCAESLPHISRDRAGNNIICMITTGVNITQIAVSLSPGVSQNFQLLPSVPAIALTSAMACRVFRNLELEYLQKT